MSIQGYNILLWDAPRMIDAGYVSRKGVLKMFRLVGVDVSVSSKKNSITGYSWSKVTDHYVRIKEVLSDNQR